MDLLRAAVNVEQRLEQFFAAAAHATTLSVVALGWTHFPRLGSSTADRTPHAAGKTASGFWKRS